jgi:hypothetical protein
MAERFAPLPATQVARTQSPVPAEPTISVEKVSLICNPASGARSQALQLRLYVVFWKSALIMASRYPRKGAEVDRKKRRAADTTHFLFPCISSL